MGRPDPLMASIHSAKRPSGALEIPVPKTASATIWAPVKSTSADTSTPMRRSASSSRAAGPRRRSMSAQETLASLPHRCRWRAAARPSPALLPAPQTTVVISVQNRATCQPAASMSQSTEMPNPSSASASTSLTWALPRLGGPLDDKRAVGVMAVDGIRLRNRRPEQVRDELGRDRADLRKLQSGVAKRAVVNRHLDAFWSLALLRQGARPPDPGHHAAKLLVEVQAFQVVLDAVRVTLRDAGEDLVEGSRAAHLLHLLEDHRGELPVALRKHGIGALGEREEQRGAAAAAALGMAYDEAVTFEVREVLAHGVGRDAEIGRDGFRAAFAFAPQQ